MLSNKICITQRGLDLISHSRQQFIPQNTLTSSRKTSLPLLGATQTTASHFQKSTQKDLSKLSMQLIKLESIGLKKLKIRKEDQQMQTTLLNQMKRQGQKKSRYLQVIIPEIVKRTRDNNKCGNLKSRLERGRAYLERLQYNHNSAMLKNRKSLETIAL